MLGGGVGSGEMGRDNGPGATQAEDETFVKQAKPVMIEWDLPADVCIFFFFLNLLFFFS